MNPLLKQWGFKSKMLNDEYKNIRDDRTLEKSVLDVAKLKRTYS